MGALTHIELSAHSTERFAAVLDPERYEELVSLIAHARTVLDGNVVWNVNSTARGGGVAELLHSLLAYTRGAGVDTRWVVVGGNDDFFHVTKRLHNHLHGVVGDGGPLGDAEHAVYEQTLASAAQELGRVVAPRDTVILHDPQTAGLATTVARLGANVIWRCHVGLDVPNDTARLAWSFLEPYILEADAYVFSRATYAWTGLDPERVTVIRPSIDVFSPKNQELDDLSVRSILQVAGLLADGGRHDATFTRQDGSPGRVDRRARIVEDAPLTLADRVITQVSRWDELKDPVGVMEGFASLDGRTHAHLLLAGPDVEAVADDPEGREVFERCVARRAELPEDVRARVHLASLPMDDAEENAAIVNAIQRHATIVVQKSLAEGFGLTVAEGMWKARPIVASRIGGIQEQVIDGETGLLIDDPRDLEAFGAALARLLDDEALAARLGAAAHERVRKEFLAPRHLAQYVSLIEHVTAVLSREMERLQRHR